MGTTRTNLELDDELVTQALAATGLKTKRAVVEEALKLLVRLRSQARVKGRLRQAPELGGRHRRDAAGPSQGSEVRAIIVDSSA